MSQLLLIASGYLVTSIVAVPSSTFVLKLTEAGFMCTFVKIGLSVFILKGTYF